VLYLLHGYSDDASAWTAVGRANVILGQPDRAWQSQADADRDAAWLRRPGNPFAQFRRISYSRHPATEFRIDFRKRC